MLHIFHLFVTFPVGRIVSVKFRSEESGGRSSNDWKMTDMLILDKVLSDERSAAYATTIDDINSYWLNCKDCGDWYKSEETISLFYPLAGWRSNKKFPFNEKLSMHLLHYQQVRYF